MAGVSDENDPPRRTARTGAARTSAAPKRSAGGNNTSSSDGAGGDAGRKVATIDRAVDVMFLFAGDEPSLGVTEIASELSISKAVVHRILTSLKERGLVTSDAATRKYSLGPAVLELAASYREQVDVRPLALEAMERLSAATQETATLSIRSGWDRVYVDQVLPPLEVKMTVKLGIAHPLHAGSSSKAFLAFLPDADQEAFFDQSDLEPVTESTVTSTTRLRKELAEIRAKGYAVSLGERQVGAASVAAPVMDGDEPVAVISVCGPLERFRAKVDEAAAMVVAETQSISLRLGRQG